MVLSRAFSCFSIVVVVCFGIVVFADSEVGPTPESVDVGYGKAHDTSKLTPSNGWHGFSIGDNEEKVLTIATGNVGGVYYPVGSTICRFINMVKQDRHLSCSPKLSNGSIENIEALRSGIADVAIIQSNVQYDAVSGRGVFASDVFAELRSLFSMHDEAFVIVVRRSSDIKRLNDLSGKIVSIGQKNSSSRYAIETIMKAKNWGYVEFANAIELRPMDQGEAICKGAVDALVFTVGHPSSMLQDLLSKCELRVLNIEDDDIRKFVQSNQGYFMLSIPPKYYQGTLNEIKTFGVKATIVTTADLSKDDAYTLTSAIFNNLDAMKTLHPAFAELKLADMSSVARFAPIHPGAQQYFDERGFKY